MCSGKKEMIGRTNSTENLFVVEVKEDLVAKDLAGSTACRAGYCRDSKARCVLIRKGDCDFTALRNRTFWDQLEGVVSWLITIRNRVKDPSLSCFDRA